MSHKTRKLNKNARVALYDTSTQRNYHAFPGSVACQISAHKLLLFDALRQNLLRRAISPVVNTTYNNVAFIMLYC